MNTTVLANANVITCDAGAGARRVDLHGATVLPGFVDTHPHLMHFGVLAEPLVDLSDTRSHADIVDRIARRARDTEPGEWIMTTPAGEAHYFVRRSYRDLAEGELPDRTVLDRAAPGHRHRARWADRRRRRPGGQPLMSVVTSPVRRRPPGASPAR